MRLVTRLACAVGVLYLLWRFRAAYALALQVGAGGFALAYILNPAVNALERRRLPRSLGVLLIFLLLVSWLSSAWRSWGRCSPSSAAS